MWLKITGSRKISMCSIYISKGFLHVGVIVFRPTYTFKLYYTSNIDNFVPFQLVLPNSLFTFADTSRCRRHISATKTFESVTSPVNQSTSSGLLLGLRQPSLFWSQRHLSRYKCNNANFHKTALVRTSHGNAASQLRWGDKFYSIYVRWSFLIMPRPLGGGIKRWCASDVCLTRTSGLSREQRGVRRLKLAQT